MWSDLCYLIRAIEQLSVCHRLRVVVLHFQIISSSSVFSSPSLSFFLPFSLSALRRELLAPNNVLLKEGDPIMRPKYAQTLRDIGEKGADYFYDSDFTERMVSELQNNYNSVVMVEDFQNYTAIEREVVTSQFDDLEVIGIPPPASGAVLGLILNILDGMYTS